MKNSGDRPDIVQDVYLYLLSRGRYPDNLGFPETYQAYKTLRRCDPELLKRYIKFLQQEVTFIEGELSKENLLRTSRSMLEKMKSSIGWLINTYDNVNKMNEHWSKSFAPDNSLKEEDSTACETKQSSEESSSIVKIDEALNQGYYDSTDVISLPANSVSLENIIIVREEYFAPPVEEGFIFDCCGCGFFNNFFN